MLVFWQTAESCLHSPRVFFERYVADDEPEPVDVLHPLKPSVGQLIHSNWFQDSFLGPWFPEQTQAFYFSITIKIVA